MSTRQSFPESVQLMVASCMPRKSRALNVFRSSKRRVRDHGNVSLFHCSMAWSTNSQRTSGMDAAASPGAGRSS